MSQGLFHAALGSLGLALAAAATAALLRLWRARPIAAYRLVLSVIVAALVLPLLQLGAERFAPASLVRLRAPATEAELTGDEERARPAPRLTDELLAFLGAFAVDRTASVPGAGNEAAAAGAPGRSLPSPAWLLALVWLAGSSRALVRSLRRLARTAALARRARTVRDAGILALWREVRRETPFARRVRLRSSSETDVPACFGFVRPVILLPAGAALGDRQVLACVLQHELVHLERRDLWGMCAQELFRAVFWFHPAAWWLLAELDGLRELSCDQLVVRRIGSRKDYAHALLSCAASLGTARPSRAVALMPSVRSKSQLRRRIEMLVTGKNTPSRLVHRVPAVAAVLVLATLWSGQLALAALSGASTPATEAREVTPAGLPSALEPVAPLDEPLGIHIASVPEALAAQLGIDGSAALLVVDVVEGSAAARAGVERYDVLVSVDGERVDEDALRRARAALAEGEAVELTVVHRGEKRRLVLGKGTPDEPRRFWNLDGRRWSDGQNELFRGRLDVDPGTWRFDFDPRGWRFDVAPGEWRGWADQMRDFYGQIDPQALELQLRGILRRYDDEALHGDLSEQSERARRAIEGVLGRNMKEYLDDVRAKLDEIPAEQIERQVQEALRAYRESASRLPALPRLNGLFDRNARGSDLLPERDSADTRRERDGDLFERDDRESSGDDARTLRELQQELERTKAALEENRRALEELKRDLRSGRTAIESPGVSEGFANLRRITDDINAGRGVIGRLINDEEPPPPTSEE